MQSGTAHCSENATRGTHRSGNAPLGVRTTGVRTARGTHTARGARATLGDTARGTRNRQRSALAGGPPLCTTGTRIHSVARRRMPAGAASNC